MALPGQIYNLYVTQADGRVFLQWDLSSGATSYSVQRSTDNVIFSVLATPATFQYLDTAVVVGTVYYYKVAAVAGAATGIYTESQSVIPTMGGEMSLGELATRCRQRADRINSDFVTLPELNSYINQSMFELYDLLIDVYEDYYKAPAAIFYSVGGNQQLYPMPDGILTFLDQNLQPFVPRPIYKLLGLDLGLNVGNNGWVTVGKFNYLDRNKFFYPTPGSTIYGVFNVLYRWMGKNLELIPTPSSNQPFRIQYIPRLQSLLQPNDLTETSISGWLEYVITDVAIKILQKEESDVSVLGQQKLMLKARIEESANNRDAGRPDTITDTRGSGYYNNGSGGGNGFQGGF